jgi:hypothetical protein
MEEGMFVFSRNPWTDPEPDEWYDEGDAVDRAYEEQRDRNLMEITHGHPAQEAAEEDLYV